MKRGKYYWNHDYLVAHGFSARCGKLVRVYVHNETGQVFSPAHAQRIAEGKEFLTNLRVVRVELPEPQP